jgi:hypothetical protein
MIEKRFAAALISPFLEMHAEDFGVLRSSVTLKEDRPIDQVQSRFYEQGTTVKAER